MNKNAVRRGLIAAGGTVLIVGAVIYGVESHGARPARSGDVTTPVAVATAEAKDFPITVGAVGTVQASNKAEVRSQVTGTIQRIVFKEGQQVHAGDVLAEIDARPYQAALAQAQAVLARDQANLINVRKDLERYTELSTKGFATSQQLDTQRASVSQLEATVKGDEAAIDKARTDLSYTRITAPIDGITGLRTLDIGSVIHPTDTQPFASITQVQPAAVVFTLPSDQLAQIQTQMGKGGLPTEARDQTGKTTLAEGTLSVVDNEVDPKTGSVRLKALFPNTDRKLWPGAFVSVKLTVDVRKGGITVPAPAIQHGAEGVYVYVAVPDDQAANKSNKEKTDEPKRATLRAEVRPVKLIDQQNDVALLEEGVDAGERVIVDGQSRLSSGAKVRIATPGERGQQTHADTATKAK